MVNKRVYIDHLQNVAFFSGLSRKELEMVASAGQQISVREGTRLVEQDTAGNDAFVLLQGSVQVKRNNRIVNVLGPGAIIGELSLLDHGQRTATAVCATDCDVLVLSRGPLRAVIEDVPAMRNKLLAALAARVRELDDRAHG